MKELPSENLAETGERIRRMRKHLGRTQVKFAEELKIPTSLLAKIEVGQQPAADELIDAIAKALEVERRWLVTGEGKSPEPHDRRRMSGAKIRRMRESLGLSREELAERIGVKPSTLHNVELGHQRLGPAATTALKQLSQRGKDGLSGKVDDKVIEQYIDRAIEETYRVMNDDSAMKAVESLTQTLGDNELTILKNLVKNKVRNPSKSAE